MSNRFSNPSFYNYNEPANQVRPPPGRPRPQAPHDFYQPRPPFQHFQGLGQLPPRPPPPPPQALPGNAPSQDHSAGYRPDPGPKVTCIYCPQRIPESLMPSHLVEAHYDLQFKCMRCSYSSPFKLDILDHLNTHGPVDSDSNAGLESFKLLAANKIIGLPSDLRGLKCRLCKDKYFLGQDRVELRSHVKYRHDFKMGFKEIKYDCRLCQESFRETETFLKHPCCKLNNQCRFLPHPLFENSELTDRGNEDFSSKDLGPLPSKITKISGENPFRDHSSGSGTSRSKNEAAPCFYCQKKIPVSEKASHKGKHWNLQFHCNIDTCSRSFEFMSQIVQHLVENHKYEQAKDTSGSELMNQGLVTIPSDLRALSCPMCPNEEKYKILAQDRYALKQHLIVVHNEIDFDKNLVTFSCRVCYQEGFKSSKDFSDHGCTNITSVQEVNCVVQDVKDIDYEPPEEEGDLRCLVCRICKCQLNGTRFFKMVQHLEDIHHLFQVSRAHSMEEFVLFGCAKCTDKSFGTVHDWDNHFDEGFKTCDADRTYDDAGNLVEKQDDKADKAKVINQEDRNPKDIRVMVCKICRHEEPKARFSVMQLHLNTAHEEVVKHLDPKLHENFVQFQCAKCPDKRFDFFKNWDSHFYKKYETCKDSYKREMEEREQNMMLLPDLRKLKCLICQFESNQSKVAEIISHLNRNHQISDGVEDLELQESKIELGCLNCPNFTPTSVRSWDQHFGKDFKICVGSSKIEPLGKGASSIIYWCDTCKYSTGDFEKHIKDMKHKQEIESRVEKVFDCGDCHLKTSTDSNLNLHQFLSGHSVDSSKE